MSFNFGQYLRSPLETYTTQVVLPQPTNLNNTTFEYSSLSMVTLDTYYFILSIPAMFSGVKGTLYIKEDNEDSAVTFYSFDIPPLILTTKTYNSVTEIEADETIEEGQYLEIDNEEDSNYGNIYKTTIENNQLLRTLVGNRYDYNGFPGLKTYSLEKIYTIKGMKTYTILGIDFETPCTGWTISCEKVIELVDNIIPHTHFKHIGIQGKTGMKYCINGNPFQITTRGIEEHFTYNENNPFYSIKVIPKQNFFLIDYEYIE